MWLLPFDGANPIYLDLIPMFVIRAAYQSRTISFPPISPSSSLSCERRRGDKGGSGSAGGGLGGARKRPAARSLVVVEVGGGGGSGRLEVRVRGSLRENWLW
jgi:hypothetical protein